ncbi:MAG: hypothetical protein WAM28_07395 [Chlamydiales bacterium]
MEDIKYVLKEGLAYFNGIEDPYSILTKEEMWKWLRTEARSLKVSYVQLQNREESTVIKLKKLYADIENLLLVRSVFPEEDKDIIQNIALLLKNVPHQIHKEEILEVVQATQDDQKLQMIQHFQKSFSKHL